MCVCAYDKVRYICVETRGMENFHDEMPGPSISLKISMMQMGGDCYINYLSHGDSRLNRDNGRSNGLYSSVTTSASGPLGLLRV